MSALVAALAWPAIIVCAGYALIIIDREFRASHARIIAALTRAEGVGRDVLPSHKKETTHG
jgi:hypothetical protein